MSPDMNAPVDVIVPVYAGLSEVRACLSSVLAAKQRTLYELIVIWDCGPDTEVLAYLHALALNGEITLLENERNLGFVETVNRGMSLHDERDVVLLNSDTCVANNWLDRLVGMARSDESIATVTPFSNNAEVCSFPRLCQANDLPFGVDVSAVDRIFAEQVTPAVLDIPTGVGFCMLIRRVALHHLGLFDVESFGQGYGEENDFCRKAVAAGMRNVLATNVFVFHAGGVSFGANKQARVDRAMALLDRRYPDYHRVVHEHIVRDPARPWRVQAVLALLQRDNRRKVLAIIHNLGGGSEQHVRELIEHCRDEVAFLIAQPKTHSLLEIELPGCPGSVYIRLSEGCQELKQFCEHAGVAAVHLHHIMGIEATALDLVQELGLPYLVTLHDYFLINGNPTLTDGKAVFCLDPGERDARCAEHYPVPLGMTVSQWRDYTGKLLQGAAVVIAPSRYTAKLFSEYFPNVDYVVVWHPDWIVSRPYPQPYARPRAPGERLRVVVIGAISREKGADMLESVAKLSARRGLPLEFHLLGYAYRPLCEEVITHGAYENAQLGDRLRGIAPHLAWFPALWPETYSYTLSACLEAGLPVAAPYLGAFPERLQARPLSWLVDDWADTEVWITTLGRLSTQWQASTADAGMSVSTDRTTGGNWYVDEYPAIARGKRPTTPGLPAIESLEMLIALGGNSETEVSRQRLLKLLMAVRELPGLRWCVRAIPFRWQQSIKRRLSARPLHEIR